MTVNVGHSNLLVSFSFYPLSLIAKTEPAGKKSFYFSQHNFGFQKMVLVNANKLRKERKTTIEARCLTCLTFLQTKHETTSLCIYPPDGVTSWSI